MACGYKNGKWECDSDLSFMNDGSSFDTRPVGPYKSGVDAITPTTMNETSTGLFDMFSPSNPNFGSNIGGAGQLLGGLGGLYQAYTGKQYYDQMGDYLDKQMGLYQQEIDRRNKTRESYAHAFN